VLFVIFYLLEFGWIADLIPDTVLKGFIEGVVWVTLLKQLPDLLGLQLASSASGFFTSAIAILQSVPEAHVATAVLGIGSVILLFGLKSLAPRLPGPLIVLVGVIALVAMLGLDGAGVVVVGSSDSGSFSLGLPGGLDRGQIIQMVPGALAIAVLGYTKTIGALKYSASQTHEVLDPNRELLAVGACNLGSGISGGYAVAGSLTSTAVSMSSGGKTQVGNLFAGLLGILTVMFLLPLFANLAFCGLAAIVIFAMSGLSNLGYFRQLWGINKVEFSFAVVTMLGVLVFGVQEGVAIGVVLSLFALAYHIHSPVTAIVGRTPAGAFVDIDDHPQAEDVPGMLIWRQYAPLTFLNARILTNRLRELVSSRDGVRVVVLDATASSGVDTTAANAFIEARQELESHGVELWIVNIREEGWKMVSGLMEAHGQTPPRTFASLIDAVDHFNTSDATDVRK